MVALSWMKRVWLPLSRPYPIWGCLRMSAASSGDSGPGSISSASGMAVLPMSCSGAATQQVISDLWMLAHECGLLRGQRAGLHQQRVGHGDLADVVQRRCQLDHPHFFLEQPQVLGDQPRHAGHALEVGAGARVTVGD